MNYVVINVTFIGNSTTYHIFTSKAYDNMDLDLDCMLFYNQDNLMWTLFGSIPCFRINFLVISNHSWSINFFIFSINAFISCMMTSVPLTSPSESTIISLRFCSRDLLSLWSIRSKCFPTLEFLSLLRILRSLILWPLHGRLMFCKTFKLSF